MSNVTKTFTLPSGKSVVVDLTIDKALVRGTATIDGVSYKVLGRSQPRGRKCLNLDFEISYLPIPHALWDEIEKTCKEQVMARMTPRKVLEGQVEEARIKYQRLFNAGQNNVAIIEARDEWDRLSKELAEL